MAAKRRKMHKTWFEQELTEPTEAGHNAHRFHTLCHPLCPKLCLQEERISTAKYGKYANKVPTFFRRRVSNFGFRFSSCRVEAQRRRIGFLICAFAFSIHYSLFSILNPVPLNRPRAGQCRKISMCIDPYPIPLGLRTGLPAKPSVPTETIRTGPPHSACPPQMQHIIPRDPIEHAAAYQTTEYRKPENDKFDHPGIDVRKNRADDHNVNQETWKKVQPDAVQKHCLERRFNSPTINKTGADRGIRHQDAGKGTRRRAATLAPSGLREIGKEAAGAKCRLSIGRNIRFHLGCFLGLQTLLLRLLFGR